jgi:thioesterase domain-containing protein
LRIYAPRPYRSPALVFVEKGCDDQERYWLSVLTDNVEVHRLAAAHRDVVAAPHLEAWAGRLRHWLGRFGGHAGPGGDDGPSASAGEEEP